MLVTEFQRKGTLSPVQYNNPKQDKGSKTKKRRIVPAAGPDRGDDAIHPPNLADGRKAESFGECNRLIGSSLARAPSHARSHWGQGPIHVTSSSAPPTLRWEVGLAWKAAL